MNRYFVTFWPFILIVFLTAYSPAFGQDFKTQSSSMVLAQKASDRTMSAISPVQMDNFVFVLKEATISGTKVKIVLEATNKSSKRAIEFINEPGSTVIVDEFRNIFGNPGGTMVNLSCSANETTDSDSPSEVKRKLRKSRMSKKVRTHCYGEVDSNETFKMVATFEGFDSGAKMLKSFDARAQINGSKTYDLQFVNILLKKEK